MADILYTVSQTYSMRSLIIKAFLREWSN